MGDPFRGKRAIVVGLGLTGVAAATKLIELGSSVTAFDRADTDTVREAAERLSRLGAATKIGEVGPIDLEGVDLVVVSPGVPPDSPSMAAAKAAGVETISEIELASRLCGGKIVAVTGTNGKTTTATLAGQLVEAGGRHAVVAGNIGTPFVSVVTDDPEAIYVVEVSSFQLANIVSFRPHVAVMLNITTDHLNWHQTMDGYVQAKSRIFANQRHSDFAVLNFDDPRVRGMTRDASGRIVPFSRTMLGEGVYVSGGWIVERLNGAEEPILALDRLIIRGAHNVENALAATAAARSCGIRREAVASTLAAFEGVEHRLEKVSSVDGVTYWNDSKATNPDATIKALEAFEERIIVLLGGRNKGNSFDGVAGVAQEHVKRAVVFGEAAPEIAGSLRKAGVPFLTAATMAEAVSLAARDAVAGDDVVLSPACASFDEFDDFVHRGRVFKQMVASIGGGR